MMSMEKLEEEFKISPVKVVLEDAADVRFALDQAMLKFLKQACSFRESFIDSNFPMILAVLLNGIAGATAFLSHKFKFQQVKLYIGLLCVAYLGVTVLLNIQAMLSKRTFLFSGSFATGSRGLVRVYSSLSVCDGASLYQVKFAPKGKEALEWEGSVAQWFHADGALNAKAFFGFLQQCVSEVQLDKKNE